MVSVDQGASIPFVRVTAVDKAFNGEPALRGVAFDVALGSTVSLLGPSGCGKTTMLRSIAGLETPDAGRISIGDVVVFDSDRQINLSPDRRQIGMVFQSYAIWPHMTVGENVGFPLKIRRRPVAEIRARVDEVLALVGLAGLAPRPSTNLSGGQQQRVALARALVHEPRLVLFDEPLSNLDANLRQQMRSELKLLQDRLGFTAIHVTHDQQEALALSDTVIVMNQGRIEAMAPPRQLFTRPPTPFVAGFVGFDNLLRGVVDRVVGIDGGAASTGEIAAIDVTCDGIRLRCRWSGGVPPAPGAAVTVAFRSDRVTIGAAAHPPVDSMNHLQGTVEACVYLGACQDCLVAVGGGRLHAMAAGHVTIGQGDRVTVSVAPNDCLVFGGAAGGEPAATS